MPCTALPESPALDTASMVPPSQARSSIVFEPVEQATFRCTFPHAVWAGLLMCCCLALLLVLLVKGRDGCSSDVFGLLGVGWGWWGSDGPK